MRFGRRVHVETGAGAEVPGIRFAGHAGTARAGIRRHQDQAFARGRPLGAGLGGKRLFGAGQAGQVEQHGEAVAFRVRRQVHGKAHRQADRRRLDTVEALHAAEAGVFAEEFEHGMVAVVIEDASMPGPPLPRPRRGRGSAAADAAHDAARAFALGALLAVGELAAAAAGLAQVFACARGAGSGCALMGSSLESMTEPF